MMRGRGVARIGDRLDNYRVTAITEDQLAKRQFWVQLSRRRSVRALRGKWPVDAAGRPIAVTRNTSKVVGQAKRYRP